MSGLKVAFVVSRFPVLSETFVVNQATGLLDRGYDVDIYTEQLCDTQKVHPDVTRYGLLARTQVMPSVPKNYLTRLTEGVRLLATYGPRYPEQIGRSLNVFRLGTRAASLWTLFTTIPTLERTGSQPYDIIHCQFGDLGFRGLSLRDLSEDTKLIVMFRGFDISAQVACQGDRLYAALFNQADFFLTNCEFFRQRLLALGCPPDKVKVHYSGLDCQKFTPTVRSQETSEIRIAATGRLVEKKGFEYSIRAVAKVAQRYPQVTFDIIGDGPLRAELTALIESLQMTETIRLLGWQDEAEIINILTRAHLFVAPSVTAADGNQDAPINVLKEAMALGLPVVSTLHGGIPELVEDGVSGLLVPERDAEAIAQAVTTLIEHPERWPDIGKAGRAYVEAHYDLNVLNDRLSDLYQQLAHLPTHPLPHYPHQSVEPMNTSSTSLSASSVADPARPAQVTLVVVPRERFSCTEASLASIYEHTQVPFELVYVDGNSPPHVQQYLEAQAQQRNFELVRTEQYLFPNQARNIGLARVKTPYLVFIDNDVVVSPGWLQALLSCAEEANAAVVGPLMCQDEPVHEVVHFAGGESHVWVDQLGRRRLREKMLKQGKRVEDVLPTLQRTPTELAEFHCVLIRRSVIDQLGALDEGMLNTKEHLDFCMSVSQLGEAVYFEPASVVTYVPGPPLERSDLTYYMLRWSDEWTLKSLHHFRDKWNVVEDGYFTSKYKKLGWRRRSTILSPIIRLLTLGRGSNLMMRAFAKVDQLFNRYLTSRHSRSQQQLN
ncbi:MAG: glycosyltransferase [Phormidesmis sp.]